MQTENTPMAAGECHPPSTLINECPVTIHNRRLFASHTVFNLRACGTRWRVAFVHKNPRTARTLVVEDEQTSSICIDMPPKEYEHFRKRMLSQRLPALLVKRDQESRADVTTVDLADRRTKYEHGAKQ